MALSELPVNRMMRNRSTMEFSRPVENIQSSAGPRITDKVGGFSQDPLAIRNMLKNITETGDVGPFSSKPTRFPHSMPRAVPDKVCGQDSNRRSSSNQRQGNIRHEISIAHPSSLASSSLGSTCFTQSQHSYRPSSRGEDDRSLSLARSLQTVRSVPSPRLHSYHQFQGQGDMQAVRSRSPYAYPTRLKRPGYRPSSPAYIDLNRQFHSSRAAFYSESAFPMQSQVSISAPKRRPSVFRREFDRAESRMPYSSSSSRWEHHRMEPFSSESTCLPTSSLFLGLAQDAPNPREESVPYSVFTDWESRRTASPMPIYYDYTEAFEENHSYMPIPPEMERPLSQENLTLHDDFSGSAGSRDSCRIIQKETLAKSSHQDAVDVENSPQTHIEYANANLDSTSNEPPWESRENESPLIIAPHEVYEKSVLAQQSGTDVKFKAPAPETFQNEEMIGLPSVSAGNTLSGHHEAASSDATASSDDADPQSASSGGSVYSVQSSSRPGCPTLRSGSADTITSLALKFQPEKSLFPTADDLNVRTDQRLPLQAVLRETSFDQRSDGEQSQIHAPTPERSVSSVSHRGRFSRILSIGQSSSSYRKFSITLKKTASNQNVSIDDEEPSIEPENSELISPCRPEQSSQSLSGPIDSGEELLHSSLMHASMKTRGSTERLDVLQSTELENVSPIVWRNETTEPIEPHLGIPTPCLSLKTITEGKSTETCDNFGSENQLAEISGVEQLNINAEFAVVPEQENASDLEPHPGLTTQLCPPKADSIPSLCQFTSVLAGEADDKSRGITETISADQTVRGEIKYKSSQPRLNLRKRAEKASAESLSGSRPWNLAASYPWNGKDPKLDVTLPDLCKESQDDDVKLPRFRLKIHRASTSKGSTVKSAKQVPPPLDLSKARKTSLSSNFRNSSTFDRKFRPSTTITQHNSSHSGPTTNKVAGTLNSPLRISIPSPCISLIPPSPGLNIEVRSFFSDDSSQLQPKGSLRQRISHLRAMATKGNSSDDVSGAERSLLNSAMGRPRASGRSIKQESIPSEGLYNLKHIRWRWEEKLKSWLHRSKDKARFWGGKMRLPGPNARPGAGVYSGL